MKFRIVAVAALTALATLPGVSNAKGCLKGAAVGGIGGHVAGHHGVIGVAAGCAVGHHMAAKKDKAAAQGTRAATTTPATTQPATTQPATTPSKP